MSRPRRVALVAGGVGLLLVAGWLLRFTVFLDFPAYVARLEEQRAFELAEPMDELIEGLARGRLSEHATARLDALRERYGEEPPASMPPSLDDPALDLLAARFAEAGLLNPVRSLSSVAGLAAAEDPSAIARCEARLTWLARGSDADVRLVLWLNGGRCDEVVAAHVARLTPVAEAELRGLSEEQRAAVEDATAHGASLMGALLDLERRLGPARIEVAHRALAQALVDHPPRARTATAIDDAIESGPAADAREDLLDHNCSVFPELRDRRYAELERSCSDAVEPDAEPTRASIFVDLLEGRVLDGPPPTAPRVSTEERAHEGEAAAAIDALVARIVGASSDGELPDQEAVAAWLDDAMDRTGCILVYEPLGFYESADLRAVCPGGESLRHLEAERSSQPTHP